MFKSRDVQNEEDDDNCVHYGTAFPPLEEDEQVVRKPVPIHEQTVTDERGRQRFHGAFTGGFSAGFFNTVGSKEGFEPATFQSSRSNRQTMKARNVNDFMDEEDINEFGIAPKRLKVNEDFVSDQVVSNARLKQDVIERHIQANPVDLGIRLLRRLGVREGKGVGANIERELSTGTEEPNVSEDINLGKVYTCARPPPEFELMTEPDSIEPDIMRKFKLAPDDVATFIVKCHKIDRKGLGYTGLNPDSFVGSQMSRFVSKSVTGMSGQAFGVGAFEDDDDDIYAQENLNEYDFELGPSRLSDKRDANNIGLGVAEGFVKASKEFKVGQIVPPRLPKKYQPSVPKDVLELNSKNKDQEEVPVKPLIFAGVRSKDGFIEPASISRTSRNVTSSKIRSHNGQIANGNTNEIVVKEEPKSKLEWSSGASEGEFKPSILPTSSRFVSAGKLDTLSNRVTEQEKVETPREKAARMKMFGKLTRTVMLYRFATVVCKRFNVKMTADNSYEPKATDQTLKNIFNKGYGSRPVIESASVCQPLEESTSDEPKKTNSLHDRTIKKSNFLAFLNDSERPHCPESNSVAEVECVSQEKPQRVSSKDFSDDHIDNKIQESKAEVAKADDSGEVLDSLKNLNLLLDVFGDDSDSESESQDSTSELTGEMQNPKRAGSSDNNVIADSVSPSEHKSTTWEADRKAESGIKGPPHEDADCFSKFFKVPSPTKEGSEKGPDNVSSSVETPPNQLNPKVEQIVESDSDDEYGPALPPPPLPTCNTKTISNSSKPELIEPRPRIKSNDINEMFVERICRELKKKKKKDKKKKSRKS